MNLHWTDDLEIFANEEKDKDEEQDKDITNIFGKIQQLEEDKKDASKKFDRNENISRELIMLSVPSYVIENGMGFFDSSPKYDVSSGFKWRNKCKYYSNNFLQHIDSKKPGILDGGLGRRNNLFFHDENREIEINLTDCVKDMFFFAASIRFNSEKFSFLVAKDASKNEMFKITLSEAGISVNNNRHSQWKQVKNFKGMWIYFAFKVYENGKFELFLNDYEPIMTGNLSINIKQMNDLFFGRFNGMLGDIIMFSKFKSDKNFILLKKRWQNAIFDYLSPHVKF